MKNKTILTSLLLLIAFLIGGISYLFFLNNKKANLISSQENQLKLVTIRQDSLSIALDQELDKLKLLRTKYSELNEQNEEINLLITQLTEEKMLWMNRAGMNQNALIALQNQLKKTIADFDTKRIFMLKEIDSLKLMATRLENTNKDLNFSNDSLRATTNDQLLVNQGILKKASRLKAENVSMVILGKNDKIINKSPYKEHNIKSISSTFNLSKNELAQKGKRSLVMRIEKPDGGILYDVSANGNTFTTSSNEQFYYTVAKDMNYNNAYEEVTLTYTKQSPMLEGTYKVNLYLDGELLTTTSFEVK